MALADLSWAVGQLAELSTRDFDVDELLRRLCEVAVQSLPVDGVGVMKTDRTAATRFVHASDPPLAGLEQLQETLQEGPCRDAIDTGQVVVAGSVAEMRWPNFEKVAAAIGIHAVLAVPMVSRGDGFGTLDLYWRAEHHADDDDRAAAQLLANVAVSYLSLARDRDQARAAQQQLAHLVLHDQLTGLPHRDLMEELIEHALTASGRTGTLVAVLFVDLDHFKHVNDTHGHRAGDDVLRVTAQRMRNAVRATDTVGRISGDEFIILCEGANADSADSPDTPGQSLDTVGRRVLDSIAQPIELRNTAAPVTITASIGVAVAVVAEHTTPVELIHSADQAVYHAKAAGRNDIATLLHRSTN